MLIQAEAQVEQNKLTEAFAEKGGLNTVRARAKLAPLAVPASQEDARNLVRLERRLELANEGHRLFDLRRWNVLSILKESRPNIDPVKHLLYPIPDVQIQIVGKGADGKPIYTQNPGYN